jgi:hypothetical protein
MESEENFQIACYLIYLVKTLGPAQFQKEWSLTEKFGSLLFRVVSRLYTGSLAGIGKLPALAGWYWVWYAWYFLYCKIWWELHFVKFCGNSPCLVHKKGAEARGKGVPAKCTIPKRTNQVFLRYRLVKYRENTDRYQTEIPNRDATLLLLHLLNTNTFSENLDQNDFGKN